MGTKKQNNLFALACFLGLIALSSFVATQERNTSMLNTPPVVNSDVIKPEGISNDNALAAKKMRETLKAKELDYSIYMGVLKAHRDKVADLKVVRRQSNARVHTTVRSQNKEWKGGYDCDDTRANVNPGEVEVCDGIDNDCDGDIDEEVTANLFLDADGDGWGDPDKPILACHVEDGYAARGHDCDDRNILIYPGAADSEGDGIDTNCDGKDG